MRMRTEREMYDLILETAKEDERVRAVYMNGSRTNPNVAKDKYRDFDIVYVVRETESFLADRNWISVFGKTAIVQEPDRNDMGWGIELDLLSSYTWLMLFEDGNRIDLCIKTPACAVENYLSDTLCIKLLDKDGLLPQIPEPNDSLYHVKKPSEAQYESCCNEFFWCLNNVAKGISCLTHGECITRSFMLSLRKWWSGILRRSMIFLSLQGCGGNILRSIYPLTFMKSIVLLIPMRITQICGRRFLTAVIYSAAWQ